jgi:hypothetical protein
VAYLSLYHFDLRLPAAGWLYGHKSIKQSHMISLFSGSQLSETMLQIDAL